MVQTTQSISNTLVGTAKSQYAVSSSTGLHQEEPKKEDNISLLFSMADSLNDLCLTLEKVDHVLKMANLEAGIRAKYKGEGK